jgi:type VI secretion system protein ImpG
MDRAFLTYYEEELSHVRGLAVEFAALHPTVARNLSLDAVPCPDPYVERLLEGVAYLAARTRMKVDREAMRHVRGLLDALYPDLSGPAPAMTMARLAPAAQVDGMVTGHRVERGARTIAGLRDGLSTRAIYTTAQAVDLWPVAIAGAEYLQDAGALRAAGVTDSAARASGLPPAEAGIRITLARTGSGALADLALDRLDLYLGGRNRGGLMFDAVHGGAPRVLTRPTADRGPWRPAGPVEMVGIGDGEGLLPRVRASFEGYRLLREYFLMPERFHYARLTGLNPGLRAATAGTLDILIGLSRPDPALADLRAEDFRLFVTPLVNLFERECNIVDLDRRTSAHVVHVDRTRPRDHEIYRVIRVEDADAEGAEAQVMPFHSVEQNRGTGYVFATERRPRRPGEDELRRGQMRTTYAGDDLYVSVARRPGASTPRPIRRLDIRALCTNRDLPILDDSPRLTLDSGDPVGGVELLGAFRRPRPSLSAEANRAGGGEAAHDDVTWRWIGQLALNHLSLAEEGRNAEPLRAMLDLYADRGDPALARHARAITRVASRPVMERLPMGGPIAFGHGTEIALDVDEGPLSGASKLLLTALLAQLFTRHAAVNSFVRTRARVAQTQTEVAWPMTPGTRALI